MHRITLLIMLAVGVSFFTSSGYSQGFEDESVLQVYIGSNANKSFYSSPFDDLEHGLRYTYNYYTPVFGANIRLASGVSAVLQASGYSFQENFMEYDYNIRMRDLIAGFKLQDSGRPFFIRVLSGINRISYDFHDIDDSIFMPRNNYSIGADVGFVLAEYKYMSLNLSAGLIRSFGSDEAHNKVYVQFYIPVSIFSK